MRQLCDTLAFLQQGKVNMIHRQPPTAIPTLAAASCAGELGRADDDPWRVDLPDFSFLPRDFIADENRAVDRTSLIWS